MGEYLLLNILVISVPLLLSFEKKLHFYKKLPYYFISILIISSVYIIWDIIATARGDWGFNPEYLIGVKIFNLPLEELLFFITVPYGIIFLYETFLFYTPTAKPLHINLNIFVAIGIFLTTVSIFFYTQSYTLYVIISVGAFFIIAPFTAKQLLKSIRFWQFMLISFIPFFVMNYVLTSLPIVTYGKNAIFGFRITSIPIEDFLYSFSLLSFYILTYTLAKEKWLKRKFV